VHRHAQLRDAVGTVRGLYILGLQRQAMLEMRSIQNRPIISGAQRLLKGYLDGVETGVLCRQCSQR
jgi:hypothetical protein